MAHIPGMIRAMATVPRVHLADPQANAQEILALLRQADEQRAELCVFPELCLCGYTCADLLLHPPLLAGGLQALETLLRAPVRAAFVVGLPLEIGGRLYNCAAAVCGGRILGVVPKAHLPNSGEFYEKRWFEPGASAPESMTLCGQSVPVGGDLVFDGGRFSFGIELCEDLWVPAPPSARLCMGGALMIVNPSASNELVTKHRYRCELIAQQSARCLCGYLYAGAKLGGEIAPVVEDILDTPISPELIPSKAGELTQRTEDTLGAYALHDFFLYHMMDSGASPLKLYPLAKAAFDGQYADDAILAALRTFVRRFFTQQFKRSAMPDGPKVGSVSLSPRGDWRMPSDAQSILWMQEVEQLERQHP